MGAERRSLWWVYLVGMWPYSVSIAVIWAACASSVLIVLAIVAPGVWLHVAFAGGAALELGLSYATLRFLRKASLRGHFDL